MQKPSAPITHEPIVRTDIPCPDVVLDIRNLSVAHRVMDKWITTLDDVSLTVTAGSTLGLVGETGSGKSTIAQAILRLLPRNARIDHGSILFHDALAHGAVTDLVTPPADGGIMQHIRGGRISMIFQDPMSALSPLHTIGDQIQEAYMLHAPPHAAGAYPRTIEMLEQVGFPHPEQDYDKYPFELSGGLRQRAMIAMALITQPTVLIADEPTTALDVTLQGQILDLIQKMQSLIGMAVIFVTHDLGVIAQMADQMVVLYRGRVMESGYTTDLFHTPKHPYLQSLFNALPGKVKRGNRLKSLRPIEADVTELWSDDVMQMPVICPTPIRGETSKPIVMSVKGISKSFSTAKDAQFSNTHGTRKQVLNDVSFTLYRGECLGIVGESGSGKSTLAKIIMEALEPDSGSVQFEITDTPALQGCRNCRQVQYIFQDPTSSLNPRMTVFNLITETLSIHKQGTRQQRETLARKLLHAVGLNGEDLNRYPHSFSGGQRQRLGIARALASQPSILLCDEPTSALDVSVQAQILNLLADIQQALGLTMIFISHDLSVVRHMCDRVLVLYQGEVVECRPTEDLFANPQHPYTQHLLSAAPSLIPKTLRNPANAHETGGGI